ncbi:PilZ domain-containing protein [Yoonia sp. 2307UL14-13]|uniref:PilZ domain-containing protein n=1 Tax=Yoonia sp. 2307UL14-13 TaxID=3126506 RepID=UPI00309E7B4C
MQYRPHRYNTQYPVEIHGPTGLQKAHVIDVHNNGARIEGIRGYYRGDKVQMAFLNHRVEAVVLWSANGRMGLTFRPGISDDQVDTLRYRRDGRAGRRGAVGFGFAEMR